MLEEPIAHSPLARKRAWPMPQGSFFGVGLPENCTFKLPTSCQVHGNRPTIRIETMNKPAAWLLSVAMFLSGCKNVPLRTETETHSTSYSPGTIARYPEKGIEKLTTQSPRVDSSNTRFSSESDTAIRQDLTRDNPKDAPAMSADFKTEKKTGTGALAVVSADGGGTQTAGSNSIFRVGGRSVDAETPPRSGLPSRKAARIEEKNVEDKGDNLNKTGNTVISDQAPEQVFSREVWYCIASICGAIFTCILSPLTLDLIRKRFGLNAPQSHSQMPVRRKDNGDKENENERARMQVTRING